MSQFSGKLQDLGPFSVAAEKRGGGLEGGGKSQATQQKERAERSAVPRGEADRKSDVVFLVPHMGMGRRSAQQGLDVTQPSSRPELLLAAPHTPASTTGLFWLSRGAWVASVRWIRYPNWYSVH